MLARRSGHLRTALAVLALIGQLTPAVALPGAASFGSLRRVPTGPCGSPASGCSCSAVQRAALACCCSEPAPAPEPSNAPKKASYCDALGSAKKTKGCCEAEPKAAPAVPAPKPAALPDGAMIIGGGKCKCDKPAPVTNLEPAVPHAPADLTLDVASEPRASGWVARVVTDPLPPPYPPPRA